MAKLGWCLSVGQEQHARCWGRTPGGLTCSCEPCHGHEPWFTSASTPDTMDASGNDDEGETA